MALVRGNYGLEYFERPKDPGTHGLGRTLAVVAVIALISLTVTLVKRYRAARASVDPVAVSAESTEPVSPIASLPPPETSEPEPETRNPKPETRNPEPETRNAEPDPPSVQESAAEDESFTRRPVVVRNLLLRLDEAERSRNVEMAISTIEQLRGLPGSPAADLDDSLARRLGALNVQRLFTPKKNAQWVKSVVVKRGDSASRIAVENGATLASTAKLNGGAMDRLVAGQMLQVMDHPRFSLVLRRRSRTADLSLNGKFFKRYDLIAPLTGKAGLYEVPASVRSIWKTLGASFKPRDRSELELLLPKGAPVMISEM